MKGFWYVLFAASYALAAPPTSLTEVKTSPKRVMVFFCYASDYATRKGCAALRKIVSDRKTCDPIELAEPKDGRGQPIENPTPEQVEAFLKAGNFPAHVPVVLSAHAIIQHKWNPASGIETVNHQLSTPKEPVDTTAVRDLIFKHLEEPSLWLRSCRAGMVCGPSFCMGGACGANQKVTVSSDADYMDNQTADLLEVLCNKIKFDEADGANADATTDGKITGPELTRYFCEKKQYHPYEDVYINTRVLDDERSKFIDVSEEDQSKQIEEEKKKLRDQLRRDMNDIGNLGEMKKRLARWKDEVKENRRQSAEAMLELEKLKPKMAAAEKELEQAKKDGKPEKTVDNLRAAFNALVRKYNVQVHNANLADGNQEKVDELEEEIGRLGYLKKIYGTDVDKLMSEITWKKIPGGYKTYDARTKQPTDYQLRAIFPNPDQQTACVWAGRREFAHPQVDNLTLYYEPAPRSPPAGSAQGTPGAPAEAHAPAPEKK